MTEKILAKLAEWDQQRKAGALGRQESECLRIAVRALKEECCCVDLPGGHTVKCDSCEALTEIARVLGVSE